jgi:uncharacterized RDD family membrane protein YckC
MDYSSNIPRPIRDVNILKGWKMNSIATIIQKAPYPESSSTASIKSRGFALLIDICVINLIRQALIEIFNALGIATSSRLTHILHGYGISLAIPLVYFSVLESISGQTLGKAITQIKVTNYQKERQTPSQIIIRTISKFIPFDGLTWIFGKKYIWHDLISKSIVISTKIKKAATYE